MLQRALAGVVIGFMTGCATLSTDPGVSKAALLDGQELVGVTVPAAEEVDILGVSDEMREFVDSHGRYELIESLRFRRLTDGLTEAGYLSLNYDPRGTFTAEQTFRDRTGNCLSFTNLFVALLRDAGFDVEYQLVDVPPIWDEGDGWVILNNHINLIVREVRMGAPVGLVYRRDYVVDFNTADYQGSFNRRVVNDRTAFALFYANRGVEAMRGGDVATAFSHFKRAIAKDPNIASVWVDLGALYSRQGRTAYAEVAYKQALVVEPNDKSALTNLARLYEQTGNVELASEYRSRIQGYEEQNPYSHYQWAVAAYRDADYPRALEEVRTAILLKRDDHRFYFLEALIYYRAGEIGEARSAIAKAERYTQDPEIKQRYASKLSVLAP